jgi:hypothetical protein
MTMKRILFIMFSAAAMSLLASCSGSGGGSYSYDGRTYHHGAYGVTPSLMHSNVVGMSAYGGYAAGHSLGGVLGGVSGRSYGYGFGRAGYYGSGAGYTATVRRR